ncbi:MAG: hypothetical protein HXY51_00950 [Nitrospirae bacterium]|nr:hypothetical protein [Nitrospirota bacterium]
MPRNDQAVRQLVILNKLEGSRYGLTLGQPVNKYSPNNPLNPANKYNFDMPFAPLDGGSTERGRRW